MHSLRFVIVVLIVFLTSSGFGQDLLLKGRVIDSFDGTAIRDCHVTLNDNVAVSSTNARGEFQLIVPEQFEKKVTLFFSHLSYQPQQLEFDVSEKNGQEKSSIRTLEVKLVAGAHDLGPLTISDNQPPELVYGNARHSIADYEIVDGQLLLLTYERTLRRQAKIYLSDTEMQLQDSLILPARIQPIGLVKDYSGRIYLETAARVFLIRIDEEGLKYSEVDKEEFRDQIAPIIDTVGGQLLFSTWTTRFPAFDYYGFEESDSSYHHIRQIADKFMLELCRAEYKYLNTRDKLKLFRLELETGIEREVLACISTFEEGMYYDPIHAPMFVWEDSIYIFDHHNNYLFIHDSEHQAIDSVSIDYHSPGKVMSNPFTDRLVMDEGQGDIYAIFQSPGGQCTLGHISTASGKLDELIKLDYDYPEGIRVLNGEVYYIYRPFESMQKKYLYKETVEG